MKQSTILLIMSMLLAAPATSPAQECMAAGRQALAPVPLQAAQSLNGTWEINMAGQSPDGWKPVQVPGEPAMQGFTVQHDQPFHYRKKFTVPAGAAGKLLAIRFNGVYSYARVWVNGRFLREHFGGFTAWECDVTPYVKPGEAAELLVEVTDRTDEISFASGYAHHPIGGILREVQLIVRPKVHLQRLYTNTALDGRFRAGELTIDVALNQPAPNTAVAYTLVSPNGKKAAGNTVPFPVGSSTIKTLVQLPQAETWTAEQPRLYRLDVTVMQQGKRVSTVTQQVGFREVAINDKQQLLVNGMPVKLRGACRHDMHPLLGRSTNRAQDSLDVILAKEANLNFIRTSHYPPTKDFLEFCDRYGIYVQEETAICFVAQDRGGNYNKSGASQNDTAYTARYLGQLSEMIDRDRNHAAVIMWSIGNESSYGSNFQQEYDFVKKIEPTRPVSWSWPSSAVKAGKRCFDIAVGHYPLYHGNGSDMGGIDQHMVHKDYPLLSDEWAHVACYNVDMLRYDPNVKDFWGRSMDTTWLNRFDVAGNIGGAIWGMIDESFQLPGKVTGYGPWGFIDVWRRKKAEFWNTKKAYSPVRIGQTHFDKPGVLEIPVKNRFDHTDLSALHCKVTAGGKTTPLKLSALAPHASGVIRLPVSNNPQQSVLMQFFDGSGRLIDEERISWGTRPQPVLPAKRATKAVNENLMPQVVINKPVQANAFKNSAGVFSGEMKAADTNKETHADREVYRIKGMVDNYPVGLSVTYYNTGLVEVKYEADSIPRHTWEIGIRIPVPATYDEITWERRGYWTTYPEGHLSAASGTAQKHAAAPLPYRTKPRNGVADDVTDYYLAASTDEQKATMKAGEGYRAKKENIYSYRASQKGKPGGIRVISDGSQAAKMNVDADGRQWLLVADKWDYWALSWGNYQGTPNKAKKVSGTVKYIIE